MKERVCEDSRQMKTKAIFAGSSRVSFLQSEAYALHSTHDSNAKSQDRMETAGFRECLTGKAFPRDTCETFYFTKLSFLIHTICTHTIYTPITHIC